MLLLLELLLLLLLLLLNEPSCSTEERQIRQPYRGARAEVGSSRERLLLLFVFHVNRGRCREKAS